MNRRLATHLDFAIQTAKSEGRYKLLAISSGEYSVEITIKRKRNDTINCQQKDPPIFFFDETAEITKEQIADITKKLQTNPKRS